MNVLRPERVHMTKANIKEGTSTEARTLPQGLSGTCNGMPGRAGTGQDGYKTAARLVGTVLELSKKGTHTYKTAAECWDRPGQLQHCSGGLAA